MHGLYSKKLNFVTIVLLADLMTELAKTKVDSSYSVTFLNWTPTFEWCD